MTTRLNSVTTGCLRANALYTDQSSDSLTKRQFQISLSSTMLLTSSYMDKVNLELIALSQRLTIYLEVKSNFLMISRTKRKTVRSL